MGLIDLLLSLIVVTIEGIFWLATSIAWILVLGAIGVVLVPILVAQGIYLECKYVRWLLT